jgi:hypothetical protein
MLGISSIEAIYVALVFIVPGYVFALTRNLFVAGQEKPSADHVLAFVTYSAVNFALFGWITYTVISSPTLQIAALILVLVVIPGALGFTFGAFSQKGIVGRICRRIGLNSMHPVPRAWEHVFFTASPSWVIVKLKDGGQYRGWWGGRSFASSDTKERDLYISEVFDYSTDESEPWRPTGKGVFIAAGEIRSIEFIPHEEDRDVEADRSS